jgi:ATP-dependent helicase/nuclease subunit A
VKQVKRVPNSYGQQSPALPGVNWKDDSENYRCKTPGRAGGYLAKLIMPETKLTAEQRAAIECREVSVSLSAGAGCGKTHVLTNRFLSHLEPGAANGARLGQLIAITFTDAAAREMRTRIRKACHERLTEEAGEANQNHWLRLVRELDTARVSTIHAFCTGLLRAHAAEASLDPTFDVLEQGEADLLRLDAIDDVLRRRLTQKDNDTLDLAAAFGLARLKEQVTSLLHCRHDAAFHKWLAVTPEDFHSKLHEMLTVWLDRNEHEGLDICLRQVAQNGRTDEIVHLLRGVEPAKPLFQEAKQVLLELLPKLKTWPTTPEQLDTIMQYARVKSVDGPYICTAKDWGDKEAYSHYSKHCEALRKCIEANKVLPWNAQAAQEVAELGLKMLRVTSAVAEQYEGRKRALGKLDFDDLLALAHRLLSDPKNAELRGELSDDLRLLLVDEFQDTDPLQVELVKLICGDGFDAGRLFFVGDFKQSIYRFRGATPAEFQKLRKEVKETGRLPLTVNFRSLPGILDFVNALFCKEFEEYERLQANRASVSDQAAVEFLWKLAPNKNSIEKGAREKARREEAHNIARRLSELVSPECAETPIVEKETGKPRRAKPGDIAILFRALSDVRYYEEALRDYGLDYYLVGGHAFYAQQEVFDVLNLLRAVNSAADEISLAGVLRSPFFALADESLFWLADSAGSLNSGLLADELPVQLSAEEQSKAVAAAATLQYLRSLKDRIPIATLLADALDRTGYDAALLGEFLGDRKLANLHKLIEQARAADGAGTRLGGFITQLAEFISQPPQEPLASTCPEAADVVRLMTIHRAKGLEFPLVVIPDLDRPANLKTPIAVLDAQLGPLVPRPSDDDREPSAGGMTIFAAREKLQELDERKRLLYVACTRAADYLILSSSIEAFDKPKSDWMQLIADRFDLQSGELRVTLNDNYGMPRVNVAPQLSADEKPPSRSRGPDLLKMLEAAHQMAINGEVNIPPEVAPIPVDLAAQQQFSISRLTGRLIRPTAPGSAGGSGDVGGNHRDSITPGRAGGYQRASDADGKIDPRALGLLVHDVLARIDFAKPTDIGAWCEHLAPHHVIHHADRAALRACEMIERFVNSARGRELARAAAVQREADFLLPWPERNGANHQYIRGVIDCLYQDASGHWRIADFKTNDVRAANVPFLALQYELQLYVYAMVAEDALGKAPTELVLHFLRPGVEHTFAWNKAARSRATEMLNEAIEQNYWAPEISAYAEP